LVKVSLFLQEGIQTADGTIVISPSGPLPPSVDTPGTITYLDASGAVSACESFPYPANTLPAHSPADELASCRLGLNKYATHDKGESPNVRSSSPPPPPPPRAVSVPTSAVPPPIASVDSTSAERDILRSSSAAKSTKELNLLAELLVGGGGPTDSFKLNLFPESGAGSFDSGGSTTITIDLDGQASDASGLAGIVADLKVHAPAEADNGGELLAALAALAASAPAGAPSTAHCLEPNLSQAATTCLI